VVVDPCPTDFHLTYRDFIGFYCYNNDFDGRLYRVDIKSNGTVSISTTLENITDLIEAVFSYIDPYAPGAAIGGVICDSLGFCADLVDWDTLYPDPYAPSYDPNDPSNTTTTIDYQPPSTYVFETTSTTFTSSSSSTSTSSTSTSSTSTSSTSTTMSVTSSTGGGGGNGWGPGVPGTGGGGHSCQSGPYGMPAGASCFADNTCCSPLVCKKRIGLCSQPRAGWFLQ